MPQAELFTSSISKLNLQGTLAQTHQEVDLVYTLLINDANVAKWGA